MQEVSSNRKPVVMEKMVGWFDLAQLVRTAIEVLISTIFSRHFDFRLRYTGPAPNSIFDYSRVESGTEATERKSIWIDFVADLADGWNSTYSVAYELAKPSLTVGEHRTERGEILIFGGDEVYPIPNRKEYRNRLIAPYESALGNADPSPQLFAIPGNHDWYDSLVSFTRLFCADRKIGAWQTRQDRSYFALKLPHDWWLIGTDVQLVSDIDDQQVKYFQAVAEQMGTNDNVILCQAEPQWVYAGKYEAIDDEFNENNLLFLQRKIFQGKIMVFLAGDLHHYRRHENNSGGHKITAGGGGAFLHPTHDKHVDELAGGYKVKASFPAAETSRRLTWRNLFFFKNNPKFGVVPAAAYLLLCWTFRADLGQFLPADLDRAFANSINLALVMPGRFVLIGTIILGFVLFTDTHSRAYRWFAGGSHAIAHLVAALACGWFAAYVVSLTIVGETALLRSLLTGTIVFVGGWVLGSTIMGAYLLISLNVFGRHGREAFSALAIEDWKNFLRMHIDEQGSLTIYPIGLKRVCKQWKEVAGFPRFVPVRETSEVGLIEPPIRVQRASEMN